jgi:hypothetical protein
MSEVTPLPTPHMKQCERIANKYVITDIFIEDQLQAYGAAEYQRAIEDAATELEGLQDQTGCNISDIIRNLK